MTISGEPYFSVLVDFSKVVSDVFFARPPRHIGCPGTEKFMVSDYHTSTGVCLPSIFAWSETLHACGGSSINQVLLGLVCGICKKLDKRQEGVCSLHGLYQVFLVFVVNSAPSDPGWKTINWAKLWVFLAGASKQRLSRQVRKIVEQLTFRLNMVISCLPAAARASMTSLATSCGYINSAWPRSVS